MCAKKIGSKRNCEGKKERGGGVGGMGTQYAPTHLLAPTCTVHKHSHTRELALCQWCGGSVGESVVVVIPVSPSDGGSVGGGGGSSQAEHAACAQVTT
jgi:hypothetical protein